MSTNFTAEQTALLEIINLSVTSLSVLSLIFVMYCYRYIPALHTFPMKLIMSLVVSEFFFSTANLLSFMRSNPYFCFVEGYLRASSSLSAALWISIFIWVSYRQITNFNKNISSIYPKALFLNLSIALLPSSIAAYVEFTTGNIYFGNDLEFCSIIPAHYEMLFVEGPVLVVIIIVFYYVFKIIWFLKEIFKDQTVLEYSSLTNYAFIFAILWMIPVIDRIIYFFNGTPIFPLVVTHIILSRAVGVIITIIFYKTKRIKIREFWSGAKEQDPSIKDPNTSQLTARRDSLVGSVVEESLETERRLLLSQVDTIFEANRPDTSLLANQISE